ncbi:MAG: leucine-rich repeat protein, partial [Clostridia bacterium]|nr:leucine-rich repeat protein [Clostridia bacterium]
RTHSTNDNSAHHVEEKIYAVKSQQSEAGYTDAAGNFEASVFDSVLIIRSLGDDKILTGTSNDAFVTYLKDFKTAIKTVKIIGEFAEFGDTQFMFQDLDAVTTLLIDYKTNTIGAYNTTTYAGNFVSMSKLVTLGHVEFDPEGNVVTNSSYNTYEEGVCDLRGFDFVVNHTGNKDYDLLPRSILRSSGVKKVIMPDALECNGKDVASRLPTNGLALCYSLTEVVVPSSVRVSEMGKFFVWKSSGLKTIRFEGGVSADFAIVGKNTDAYPTAEGIVGATVYCPSQADVDKVCAALSEAEISDTCIKADVAVNDGFTVNGTVLTILHNGDTGIAPCDVTWYEAMNGITEVVIEEGYRYLGANIFNMATVEKVCIPESVTDISPDCFGGKTDFVIFGVKGSYAETYARENGIDFKTGAALLNAITADGFNVRVEEYTGIRGLFTFSEAIAAENKALGYTLVEYGALTCSGEKYKQYGYSAEAIYNACGTDNYLVKVVIEGEDGVFRFVDPAKKQFCIALVDIPSEHYTSDIYMCGYQVWTDGREEYFMTTEYVPTTGEKNYTSNLYELTMFGFKSGLVNSETMDDVCLWDVLETQAVTLDNFNEGEYTHSSKTYAVTADKAYTLESDGSFTFKNIPLLDYTGSATSQVGWNFVPTGLEKQSTTGVEWTLLPDGEDYVAVFRRADGLADDFKALLPRQTNDENSKAYFGHLPIHESWGCLTSAKDGEYAINSPRLPATDVARIRTVVVDYGVNGHEAAGLGFITGVLTVVYPNGYTNVADYGFNGCKQLKDVIWANDGIPHGKDVEGIPEGEGLLDLRGMRELKTTRFIYGCSAVENVVFSTLNTSEARINSLFMNASRVKRGWISNAAQNGGVEKAPAANVIDMRAATNVHTLTAGAFEVGAVIHSIYLPATITTISENKSSYGYNMAFGNGYAHKIYTEQEDFKAVLQKYYDYVKASFTGNAANALDKLIINDMPIAQYLAS